MFVYVSMIIWSAFCSILSKGSEKEYIIEGKKIKKTSYFFVFITMGYIILFMGTLSGAFDATAYEKSFDALPSEPSQISEYMSNVGKYPLFFYIQILFKCYVSTDFTLWLTFIVAFDCLVIGFIFREYSHNYFLSVFLFITSGKVFWLANAIKQFWAACIILLFAKFLFEKKFWIYALGVLIASQFHTSALIALPVYFFVHGKPWNKKMLIILFGSTLSIIFLTRFTNILGVILDSTSYDVDVLLTHEGSSIVHVFIAAVPAIIAFIRKEQVEKTAPPYINICINMSIVTACVYLIASFTSGIHMGRIPVYFEIYSFLSLPWLIENAFDKETTKMVKFFCILLYLIMFFLVYFKSPYYSDVLKIYVSP